MGAGVRLLSVGEGRPPGAGSALWVTAGGCGGWWVVVYVGICDWAGGTGLSRTMPVADAAALPWGGPVAGRTR